MRAIGLAVMLGIIGLLATGLACGGNSSPLVSGALNPEGVTWVLRTIYGEPVLDGTFVWLRLDGDEYQGVDGCNGYGGKNQHGEPVVGDEGEFNPSPASWTDMLCELPGGVMEQAEEYRRLLGRQGQSLRVGGDRLEILDWSGEVGLVFVRQIPLAGEAVELAGTAWRFVAEDSAGGDVRAATLVFLDDSHAVGITACRGYVAAYRVSGGRLNLHSSGMTEYGRSECAEETRRREGEFTTDLSRAIEYSVSEEDGMRRLRILTSRGRTATFEPVEAGAEGLFGVEWRLTAIVDTGQTDPGKSLAKRTDRLVSGTEVTAKFDIGGGMSGFGGCNSYGATLEPEEPFARKDGTFAKGAMAIESTVKGCSDPPGVQEQRKRFTELIPQFERYRIYGKLLVVHTDEGVVLLFRE